MSRKIWALMIPLLLTQAQSAPAKGLFGLGDVNEAKDAALTCEKQGKWKQIHWRQTMDEAMADSAKTQKPLMVALVVGKKGEKNASEC